MKHGFATPRSGWGGWTLRVGLMVLLLGLPTVQAAEAPAPELLAPTPVATPIVHQPSWREELQLFGYHPRFVAGEVSFDTERRPYIRDASVVQTLDDAGQWIKLDFTAAVAQAYPKWNRVFHSGDFADEQVVFDTAGAAYLLVDATRSNIKQQLLLYSRDHCRTWSVHPLGEVVARLERADGHNNRTLPPAILIYSSTSPVLRILTPRKQADGALELPPPVVVTETSLLAPNHSGGGNSSASRGELVHITWPAKAPPPGVTGEGTPCYVATFDRRTQQVSAPAFVGFGGTVLDNHNTPAIALDSHGTLHVVLGAHHDCFRYTRSLTPDHVDLGWTPAEEFGVPRVRGGGSYTYVGLVCDRQDTLHVVARWAGEGYIFRLVHLHKPAGEPWAPQQTLVQPFRGNYSVWYHKLNLGEDDRLWCAYTYCGGALLPEEVAAFSKRHPQLDNSRGFLKADPAMLLSDDHGETWRLATTADLAPPALRQPDPQRSIAPLPSAPPVVQLSRLAQLGGELCSVAVNDKLVAAVLGDRLIVLELNDQGQLKELSQLPGLEPRRAEVTLYESVALIANQRQGVLVVDLHDPAQPRVTATLPMTAARQVRCRGSRALVAGAGGVQVLDLTTPTQPKLLGQIGFREAFDAAWIDDHTAYVALGNDGMVLLDLRDPAQPQRLAEFAPQQKTDTAYHLAQMDQYLLVSPGPGGVVLRVLDVTQPREPQQVSQLRQPTWGWGLRAVVAGKLALLPCANGMNVVDLSNPAAPEPIMQWAAAFRCHDLAVRGHFMLTACGDQGMHVIDFTNPRRFRYPGSYAYPHSPWATASSAGRVVVLDWPNTLRVHDAHDAQSNLPELAAQTFKGSGLGLAANRTLAAVAQGTAGVALYALDHLDQQPVVIATPTPARAVALTEEKLYVADAQRHVLVYDLTIVSAKQGPALLTTLTMPAPVLSLTVSDGRLWIATEQERVAQVLVYDLAAPGESPPVATLALPVEAWSLHAQDEAAYLACGAQGLWKLVLHEGQLKAIGQFRPELGVWGVSMIDQRLYLATASAGLQVFAAPSSAPAP